MRIASEGVMVRIGASGICLRCLAAAVVAGCAAMSAAAAETNPAAKPKRTIIESLDNVVDKSAQARTPNKKSYDFSVDRQLLPPVGHDGQLAGDVGWSTVVEADEMQTGALPVEQPNLMNFYAAALAVFGLTVMAFMGWRLSQSRSATAATGLGFAPSQRNPKRKRFLERFRQSRANPKSRAGRRSQRQSSQHAVWDEQTKQTSAHVIQSLSQIESIVARLHSGSPLRDVLSQEMRLIHYRIEAATEAARSGQDDSNRASARFHGLVRELERVRRIANGAAASVIDTSEQFGLPQTEREAYALLGVNPDVSPPVLKKLVDALRMTWHPDHARHEADRALREERMKQINTAWDLINKRV